MNALTPHCRSGESTSSLWVTGDVGGEEALTTVGHLYGFSENLIFSPRPSANSDLRSANAYVIVCNLGSAVDPH